MRNLEEEYKKSQQDDTPDLWARIEKNLPEKKKCRKFPAVTRYMAVAAAALVLCILIPGMLRRGSEDFTSQNSAYDSADSAAMPEYAEEENGASADSSAMPEYAEEENCADGKMETMLEDAAELQPQILIESMEVTDSIQAGERTVYILLTPDGATLRAVLSEASLPEPRTGQSYTFTLQEEAGEDWEYLIVEIK